MKYLVIICDGMADEKIDILDNKTPLAAADTPIMDYLAERGVVGNVNLIPSELNCGSLQGNLSILGYDIRKINLTLGVIEANIRNIKLSPDDYAIRARLIRVSSEPNTNELIFKQQYFRNKIDWESYISFVKSIYKKEKLEIYHMEKNDYLFVWRNQKFNINQKYLLTGASISGLLPKSKDGEFFLNLTLKSYEEFSKSDFSLDNDHPNSIYFYEGGSCSELLPFHVLIPIQTVLITGSKLINGICNSICLPCEIPEGANGLISTDLTAKTNAAIRAFHSGNELTIIHINTADEYSHLKDALGKTDTISKIDSEILKPLYKELEQNGEDFRILVLPDHRTYTSSGLHELGKVPFLYYNNSRNLFCKGQRYVESEQYDNNIEPGHKLIGKFIRDDI